MPDAGGVRLDVWLGQPGLPQEAPQPGAAAFAEIDAQAASWKEGAVGTGKLPASGWTTQEWLRFLRQLPAELGKSRMTDLDAQFHLTDSGNSEIVHQWLLLALRNGYEPAYPRLRSFLYSVGRRKFLKPLYQELGKRPEGQQMAQSIYKSARPGYHPIAQATVDGILSENAAKVP